MTVSMVLLSASRARRWLRRLPFVVVAAVVVGALFLPATVWVGSFFVDLPSGALSPRSIAAVRVTSRRGVLLREARSREDGAATWVKLSEISPHLVAATLAGEDRRFREHSGVDWLAVGRAVLQGVRSGEVVSGASTVTMQLARLLGDVPRSAAGKVHQMALAVHLERRLSKDEILWHYLNRAPYGNGAFGAEAAARRYLGKSADRLTLAEGALLSALPRGPGRYDPFRHRARLLRRQRYILGLMRAGGRISAEAHRLALRQPIDWERARRPFLAPHLTTRLLAAPELRRAARIRTTVDLPLQSAVEREVRAVVSRLRGRGVSTAAALVVDNATGEVLAHVGSADFFDEAVEGQNDGTLALRQPGSAVKPFTYALALEDGLTPATLLRDLPSHFATEKGDYAPRNYDDTFHGPVRVRTALGSSYNVPAVRVARRVGVDRLLERYRALGMASLGRGHRHYGLGLTLGNGEVTLTELVGAYVALARGGTTAALRTVIEARTPEGEPVVLSRPASRRVMDRRAAFLVTHILSDPMARLPAFGRNTPFSLGFPVAVKTGTSKDFRDNWTVGYTPRVTVGVWVGNFDGSGMHNVSGITGAGPLWARIMLLAAGPEGDGAFSRPAGLTGRRVCPLSGALVGPYCPGAVDELFVSGSEPTERCAMHAEVALERVSGLLAGPGCPEAAVERRVFTLYPPVYAAWARDQGVEAPPTRYSDRCPAPRVAATRRVAIRLPVSGDRFFIDPDLRRGYQHLPLEAVVSGPAPSVQWLVNHRPVARAPYPYRATWPIRPGRHTIVARLPDGTESTPVHITVE